MRTMIRRMKFPKDSTQPISFRFAEVLFELTPEETMIRLDVSSPADRWDAFVQYIPYDTVITISVSDDGVSFLY